MKIDKVVSWGVILKHGGEQGGGEFAIPDDEMDIELPEQESDLSGELLSEIEGQLSDELEGVTLPLLSGKRKKFLFARIDLGGYWSPWIAGDDIEEVMEQMDDLYGIYNDYL